MTKVHDSETIRNAMLISGEEQLNQLMDSAKYLVGFDKTGTPLLKDNYASKTDRRRITLFLTGAYFAHKAGLRAKPTASGEEIATELEEHLNGVWARLKELKDQGIVIANDRNTYQIVPERALRVIKAMEKEHWDKNEEINGPFD